MSQSSLKYFTLGIARLLLAKNIFLLALTIKVISIVRIDFLHLADLYSLEWYPISNLSFGLYFYALSIEVPPDVWLWLSAHADGQNHGIALIHDKIPEHGHEVRRISHNLRLLYFFDCKKVRV